MQREAEYINGYPINYSAKQWSFAGSHIAVIEDDPDTAMLLQLLLEDADAEVSLATSAHDALQLLSQTLPRATGGAVAQPQIDLIVCDLRLRDGDGADIVLQLRSTGYRLPPLIVVSAGTYRAVAATAARVGAAAWLSKPFELQTLLEHIRDGLGR